MLHALVDLWNYDIDQKLGVEQARGPNKMRVSLPYRASVFAPLNLLLQWHDVWLMQIPIRKDHDGTGLINA